MPNPIADQITKAFGRAALKPFMPVAYYDKHMDCIRVELRDCSFTEERINPHVTFLEDNYPASHRNATAGIMIKGVKHFFASHGIPLEGIVYVTAILDQVVKQYPELAEERICKIVNELDLTVKMSEPEEISEPDELVPA
jgi:hypothetical protein